jgi:transposase
MAQLRLEHAGKLTAIFPDNASVHFSLLTQQQWEISSAARQLIFFLPPYSPLQEPY